jgi:hypothetical protein
VTAWHALQLVLAGLALLAIVRSALELGWRAPADAEALSAAVSTALAGKQHALAVSIAAACVPAWAASVVLAGLEAAEESRDPVERAARAEQAMEERASELTAGATDRLRTLLALGRIASPLSFLAIALELGSAFGGGHGLLALQRGLVESIAIAHALLSFGIGVGTAGACMAAASFLRARLQAERVGLTRIIARIAKPLTTAPHM